MWIILLLLWLLPLALGIVLTARVSGGASVVSDKEWRLLFGDTKEMQVSIWTALPFALLTLLFFFAGIVEGLVLTNLGSVWLVLVPLVTGLGAMLLVGLWLRMGARETRLPQHRTARSRVRESELPV
ncbi:MAG: hypothetical protein ACREO5_00400 [Candidatus Binatia bacterium]